MMEVTWIGHPEPAQSQNPALSKFCWDWGLYLASSSASDDRPSDVV